MTTPTGLFIPPPDASDVAARLEAELRRQQEATPELIFDEPAVHSYKWQCELEQTNFTPRQVDAVRLKIHEPEYWECEARHLKDTLFHSIWKDICDEHAPDGSRAAKDWRNISLALARRLRRRGLNAQQMRKCRLAIENQDYWRLEADILGQFAAAREHDWLHNRGAATNGFASPPQTSPDQPPPRARRKRRLSSFPAAEPRRSKRLHTTEIAKRSATADGNCRDSPNPVHLLGYSSTAAPSTLRPSLG